MMSSSLRSSWNVLSRVLPLAAAWLILAGADPASWIIGAPFVMLAVWASLALHSPGEGGFSPLRVLVFAPFFLWQSFRGGVDVALRVLRPRLRVAPGARTYRLRLVHPSGRVLLLNTLSLLPGTLSADLQGDLLTVHALDVTDTMALDAELVRLERRVAALFRETLGEEGLRQDDLRGDAS